MENNFEQNHKNNNVTKIVITVFLIVIIGVGGFFGYRALTKKKSEPEKPQEKQKVESKITPLLYEVTKDGSNNKMYLFGSIHIANKEDLVFPEYVMNAYNNSHYLACEFDGVAYNSDQQKVIEDAMKMLYQDGTTIKDHLSEKTYNKLVEFLQKKNAYVNIYEQYKLYFFVSLFTSLTAQDSKINATGGVDDYFEKKAHEDKKTILEVESYDFQIGLFDEFPDELYELILEDSIDNYDESVKELQNLYNAWKSGNEQDLLKYGSEDMKVDESYTDQQKKYAKKFNKKLIDERNEGMLKKAIEYFNNDQDVFYMVGALHIVGEKGLANQLKQKGFIVKQVN